MSFKSGLQLFRSEVNGKYFTDKIFQSISALGKEKRKHGHPQHA